MYLKPSKGEKQYEAISHYHVMLWILAAGVKGVAVYSVKYIL